MTILKSIEQVREVIGTPSSYAEKKVYKSINEAMTEFISKSPLMFLSTVDEFGFPTVTPRGDYPGFVSIEDSNTILVPERKGNNLAYSLSNLISNDKVGVIFIVPNTNETLRMAGTAEILNDQTLNSQLASKTQKALLVLRISVTQCYFHCAKSFLRSELWNHSTWNSSLNVSLGKEIANNIPAENNLADELDKGIIERYTSDL